MYKGWRQIRSGLGLAGGGDLEATLNGLEGCLVWVMKMFWI